VVNLDLNNCNGTGPLPRHALQGFSELRHLNLCNNKLGGYWPDLSGCTQLETVEMDCDLSGTTPYFRNMFRSLPKLQVLWAQNLQQTGLYPDLSQCVDLREDVLPGCKFSIPEKECVSNTLFGAACSAFTKLQAISLGHNNLASGPLPDFTGYTELSMIRLHKCCWSGAIPSTYGTFTRLQVLDLNHNERLTGTIPDLTACTQLKSLDLSSCDFSGRLPDAWPTSLKEFAVERNPRLSGNISKSFLLQCDEITYSDCQRRWDPVSGTKNDDWMAGPFIRGASFASENIDYLLYSKARLDIEDCMLEDPPKKGDARFNMLKTHGADWCAWQEVWPQGLKSLFDRDVFVMAEPMDDDCVNHFKRKFQCHTADADNLNNSFDPRYELAGECAVSILHWERRHIIKVSAQNRLRIVYLRATYGREEVAMPEWYRD